MSGLVARRAGLLYIQAMDSAKVVSSINENENCTVTHHKIGFDLRMKFPPRLVFPLQKSFSSDINMPFRIQSS